MRNWETKSGSFLFSYGNHFECLFFLFLLDFYFKHCFLVISNLALLDALDIKFQIDFLVTFAALAMSGQTKIKKIAEPIISSL